LKRGLLYLGKKEVPLRRFVKTVLEQEGEVKVSVENLHQEGDLTLIYLQSYRQFLLLDERMFHSTYVQMFFLRRYDPKLFEPVVESPWGRVYRVKL
jgi:dolichyl-diphosphooligosaccharide--protein glycosyltransferase/undecaprenyl-diphosphooligosaccharide--protein glycosyltransferase